MTEGSQRICGILVQVTRDHNSLGGRRLSCLEVDFCVAYAGAV
jgi:hypothetical protein